jgi:hypothetical protein
MASELIEGAFPIVINDRADLVRWLRSHHHHGLLADMAPRIAAAIEVAPGRPAFGEDWSAFLEPDAIAATDARDTRLYVAPVDAIVRMCFAYETGAEED